MAREESRFTRELNLVLAEGGRAPLRERVATACRDAIRSERLRAGDRLPSTRALARQLGVSRGVISDAYNELAAGGYIECRDRAAPRVAAVVGRSSGELANAAIVPTGPVADPAAGREVAPIEATLRDQRVRYTLNPLSAQLSAFPRVAWARKTAEVLRTITDAELGYIDPCGHPRLRAELAEYLRRVRGVAAGGEQMLITLGNTQALRLAFGALAGAGVRRVAIENPSFDSPWYAARQAGLEVIPLPVDGDGALVEQLFELEVDAVFLTPAHQFPLGSVLSEARRARLLDWLRGGTRYVIEDDYDAEFPADGGAFPSFHGRCPLQVIYVGTASKMLAPGLRIGWLVSPPGLADAMGQAKVHADAGSPTISQLVFAEILRRGLLDRHLLKLRREWRTRRDLLVTTLAQGVSGARVSGQRSGSHVTLLFDEQLDEGRLRVEARRRGVELRTLGEYAFAPHEHGCGLVIGYPHLTPAELERAIELLIEAIDATRCGRQAVPSHTRRAYPTVDGVGAVRPGDKFR